jgi:hypothetical protein
VFHISNENESPERYDTLLHVLRGSLGWRNQMGATNTGIYHFTGNKTGERKNICTS